MDVMHREVELPLGYYDESGRVLRRAVLRKMRGHEEELLYDERLSSAKLVTALLQRCLEWLGDIESPSESIVKRLYTADRNYLMVELRRLTLGDKLRAAYQCPKCRQGTSVIEDLANLPIVRAPDGKAITDVEVTLDDGYTDRHGVIHREVVLSLPRGADEEFVAPMAEKDPMKAQDALVLRCIKRFGDMPRVEMEAYGIKILRDLTMGDRNRLNDALITQAPGVNFERTLECGLCGHRFHGALDVSGFFVPG